MSRPIVQILGLSKSYGFREIVKNIDFIVREGEKVALVGPNGVGKSTLLKIIAGHEAPTSGTVRFFRKPLSIGYLPQDPDFGATPTAWDVLLEEQERLGFAAQASAAEAISRFGFTQAEAGLPVDNLSGGQKTRLALARMWLSQPEFLLLDEPTNQLDMDGLIWLEGFVRRYSGTVLVVSHDRYFLDRVVSRVVELAPDRATEYSGTYTDYRRAKAKAFEEQLARYEAEQKGIRRIEEAIDRQMRWFEKAHRGAGKNTEIRASKYFYRARAKRAAKRAKATVKRLESMKDRSVEKPRPERAITLAGLSEGAGGRRIVVAKGLGKSFGKPLFEGSNFAVLRGEKVGIVGPNGSGKTTLIRMILGEEPPSAGTLWVSPGVKAGYLSQELADLDHKASVLGEVLSLFPEHTKEVVTKVRTLLGRSLFSGDDVEKRIGVLSTGERKRVALVKLLLSDYNLLVLDEPTEHLDLPAREKLEEALSAYSGTLLLVSHDRYLLSRVCTKVIAIEEGRIRTYLGGFEEYWEKRKAAQTARSQNRQRPLAEGHTSTVRDRGSTTEGDAPMSSGGARELRMDDCRAASPDRKLTKDERLLLETRLAGLNSRLAFMSKDDPEYAAVESEFFQVARELRSANGKQDGVLGSDQ